MGQAFTPLTFKPFGKAEEMMLTKMTDMAIKEMDSFYSTGKTMMDYFEKQCRTIMQLNPWMTGRFEPAACGAGMSKSMMAAMGLVPLSDFRSLEMQSAESAEQLDQARQEIEANQKTIADQAASFNSLKKRSDAAEARAAALEAAVSEKEMLITEQEKKLGDATQALEKTEKTMALKEKELEKKQKTMALQEKELEEKQKTIALQEKELKKSQKQAEQLEKDIAALKSQVKGQETPGA
jgi:chemotaxis protein histidine kinase CheA